MTAEIGKHDLGGTLGEVIFRAPSSFAPAQDLVSCYAGNENRAQVMRICAASLGAAWDPGAKAKPPPYPIESGDPVAYGGRVVDWLYQHKVPQARVVKAGHAVLLALFALIPSEPEVAATEDFFAPADTSTSGASESIGTGIASPAGAPASMESGA